MSNGRRSPHLRPAAASPPRLGRPITPRIDAHILLGRALGRLDRFAEALDTVHAAKRLNADDPDIYGFEAWVLLNLQRLEDARAAAQTAIRLDPRGVA